MYSIIKFSFWLSIFLIGYAYILYPMLLFLFDKFIQRPKFTTTENLPKVSLIIAAYNEEKVIEKRIKNCLELDYPKDRLEIIIASDGSDDRTNEIVRRYNLDGVILFDYSKRQGKANVLNETLPRTKHGIIIFSDANAFFEPDAIKKLVCYFDDSRIGCVCGLLKFVNAQGSDSAELENFYWRYETFLKKIEGARGSLLGANGPIYAIRKELFIPCPSDTIVEDFFIPMKILEKGYKVFYEKEAVAIEETTKHIIQEKQRRIRIGAGDFQALFRLLPMLNPLKGFSSFSFWSHKVLRWLAPFFLIFAVFLNLFLLMDPLYKLVFAMQCIFYICAVVGQILSWSGINIKPINLCYYFVSMNLSLLIGFVRYITGRQSVAWARTER
ncbi:MAG: glycosyltransferase family 2 protein [Candidatus Omnitrophica bacterium]|nr:glycosyltransferase family 2 protein [Candidatus Omnitrophota bacterium]